MKTYAIWKYLLVIVSVLLGLLYAVPNLYKDIPTIDISSPIPLKESDLASLQQDIRQALEKAHLHYEDITQNSERTIRILFPSLSTQLIAKDFLSTYLSQNDKNMTMSLNLSPSTPHWMKALNAYPMYLGLDLRGGVYFTLAIRPSDVITKYWTTTTDLIRQELRSANIPHLSVHKSTEMLSIDFLNEHDVQSAQKILRTPLGQGVIINTSGKTLLLHITDEHRIQLLEQAVTQNIEILHNRVNALGISEPVIQQQGLNRIAVELPGIQDITKAKRILGRTATLELHMVDQKNQLLNEQETPPVGSQWYPEKGKHHSILLREQIILSGEHIVKADSGFDQNSQPAVFLTFDGIGTRIFRDTTRNNVGKRMAIVLVDGPQKIGTVITSPVINEEIPNGRVQITGSFSTAETNELAILLRSGTLAAPMTIVNESIIGPSLGEQNIQKGFHATVIGLLLIALFMIAYYRVVGLISVISLAINLIFLVALLSLLQATLTVPGIAAIALTLGMAIDSNVLINERIREELRLGLYPALAIDEGYHRAFGTILDSNITTLISGLALLVFGSGPVRGFAVVHCLGILTSIYSSVFVSRFFVQLIYGRQKKLTHISIGIPLSKTQQTPHDHFAAAND